MYHKRHSDFTAIDEIRIKVVPRYKTSGLSGDEWRVGTEIEFCFKGEVIGKEYRTRLDYAVNGLWSMMEQFTSPISKRVIELEKTKCDQPSCPNDAITKYQLKTLYSDRGEKLAAPANHYRKFCAQHLRRGDCGLEDADANYEVIDGPGPAASTNIQESPATFGGVICIGEKQCPK